jgi:hypothetical protein
VVQFAPKSEPPRRKRGRPRKTERKHDLDENYEEEEVVHTETKPKVVPKVRKKILE